MVNKIRSGATVQDPSATARSRRKALIGVATGNFMEWYDFAIYAYSAPAIAKLFFPGLAPAAALLSTLAVFGVTFLSRPIGGVFFGRIGDRYGRRTALTVIILMMGVCTVLIGLLPTYKVIGIGAPLLLVVLRLGQGFSGGGESSGGATFLSEYAPAHQRGRWSGLSNGTQTIPFAVAAILILTLERDMGDAYLDWAWRIPFLIAAPLALIGIFIRFQLDDTPIFNKHFQSRKIVSAPVTLVLLQYRKELFVLIGIAALNAVAFYTMSSYFSTYLTDVVGLDSATSLTSNSIALLAYTVLIPIAGAVGDRIGRRKVITCGAIVLAVVSIPGYLLAGQGGLVSAIGGQVLITCGLVMIASVVAVVQAELFPVAVRYTGASLGYNIAYAAFGGTAPFIGQALANASGLAITPAFYLVAIALLALVPIRLLPETSRLAMDRQHNE